MFAGILNSAHMILFRCDNEFQIIICPCLLELQYIPYDMHME